MTSTTDNKLSRATLQCQTFSKLRCSMISLMLSFGAQSICRILLSRRIRCACLEHQRADDVINFNEVIVGFLCLCLWSDTENARQFTLLADPALRGKVVSLFLIERTRRPSFWVFNLASRWRSSSGMLTGLPKTLMTAAASSAWRRHSPRCWGASTPPPDFAAVLRLGGWLK